MAQPIGLKVHYLAGAHEEILLDEVKNIMFINPSADVWVVSPATLDAAFCNNLEKIHCQKKAHETIDHAPI